MHIYFLTIDKVILGVPPLAEDILRIKADIQSKFKLISIHPYPVYCFELKDKGAMHGEYLHYYCLLQSESSFINYTDTKVKGWSINLQKCHTSADVARIAGYIQKTLISRIVRCGNV